MSRYISGKVLVDLLRIITVTGITTDDIRSTKNIV